jgi:hypothetical protein
VAGEFEIVLRLHCSGDETEGDASCLPHFTPSTTTSSLGGDREMSCAARVRDEVDDDNLAVDELRWETGSERERSEVCCAERVSEESTAVDESLGELRMRRESWRVGDERCEVSRWESAVEELDVLRWLCCCRDERGRDERGRDGRVSCSDIVGRRRWDMSLSFNTVKT